MSVVSFSLSVCPLYHQYIRYIHLQKRLHLYLQSKSTISLVFPPANDVTTEIRLPSCLISQSIIENELLLSGISANTLIIENNKITEICRLKFIFKTIS